MPDELNIVPYSDEYKERLKEMCRVSFKKSPYWELHRFMPNFEAVDEYGYLTLLGGVLVGYIGAGIHKHIDCVMKDNYEIKLLCVHPDYRMKGIGTRLMEVMYDKLREIGAKKVYLMFPLASKLMTRFYGAQGYVYKEILFDVMLPGEDNFKHNKISWDEFYKFENVEKIIPWGVFGKKL